MHNSRTKNTLMNTSFAIIARIVSMVFGFIQKTIFIRTLGMSYLGVSSLFSDILTMLSLAELGIGSAIAYSLYKPIAEKDYKSMAQLMHFYKTAYRYIAFVVFLVGMSIMPFLDYIVKNVPDIKEEIKLIYFLYIINSSVSYLLVYKNTLLIAAQQQRIVSIIQSIFLIISITVECIILIIFRNFLLYLVLQILFSFFQNATINYIATKYFKELKDYKNEKLPKERKLKVFQDIRALLMYKIANVICTGTDSTIISSSLGTGNVGIIGNYRTIQGYVTSIVAQFYNSLNPSLGNLAATEGNKRQYAFYKQLNFGTFWIACFCSTCFYILFNQFIYLWLGSKEWLLPNYTVAIFVLKYYISAMIGPIGAFRQANGLFVQTKYIVLIEAILNIVISIALVKPLGILGVLLGSIGSSLLTTVWYEPKIVFDKVFNISSINYYKKYGYYLFITILSCAITQFMIQLIIIKSRWLAFCLSIAISFTIPNLIIYILFRNTTEFNSIIEFVNILIKKMSITFKRIR